MDVFNVRLIAVTADAVPRHNGLCWKIDLNFKKERIQEEKRKDKNEK